MNSNYNLYLKSMTFPKHPPLSLIQVKRFLNIDIAYHGQDDLLEDLLNMATEYAEWYTEKSFMEQKWKVACVGRIPSRIYLPCGPLLEVLEISAEDGHILSGENYAANTMGSYVQFFYLGYYGKLEITYIAGHKNDQEVPSLIKEGILKHISYSYQNRSDTGFMSNIKKIYDGFRGLRLIL